MKDDNRPQRGWWAPGGYFQKCHSCGENFAGDKRSGTCADCAYAALELLQVAEAFIEFYEQASAEDIANGEDVPHVEQLKKAATKSREVENAWSRHQLALTTRHPEKE